MDIDISTILLAAIASWRTRKGLLLACVVLGVCGGATHAAFPEIPTTTLALFFLATLAALFGVWFISSGRLLFPTPRKTIAFAIAIDRKGRRNFDRVYDKLCHLVREKNLQSILRLKIVGDDFLKLDLQASRYVEQYGVEVLISGKGLYGGLAGDNVLKFLLTVRFHSSHWRLAPDAALKFFEDLKKVSVRNVIADKNELIEFELLADELYDLFVFIIAVLLNAEGDSRRSLEVTESLKPRLDGKLAIANTPSNRLLADRTSALFMNLCLTEAQEAHGHRDHARAKAILDKLRASAPRNISVLMLLARVSYRMGDIRGAKAFTEEIVRLDRNNAAAAFNNAFFRVREGNYEKAGAWYDRIRKMRNWGDINLPDVVSFLDEEYNRDPKEHALLYGMAIVNGLVDKSRGREDLRQFLRKTRRLPQFEPLRRRAEIILASG
jgi:tetratricopeptide (TPR) repeat protein